MKKVIEGKLYNTDTAKPIGAWSNNLGSGDLNYLWESLFKTRSGAYFIWGEGGPNTKYAQSIGNNSWRWGESIYPMSPSAAREWAEKRLTTDEYIDAFGEPEEAGDGNKVSLNVTISPGLKRKLEQMKEESGGTKSISQIIEEKFAE